MNLDIDTKREVITVNGRDISFPFLEVVVQPLNLCGAPLTIQSLEWIIRELQEHGSVAVVNCGIPNQPSGLLELGAQLAEMARASTKPSEPTPSGAEVIPNGS